MEFVSVHPLLIDDDPLSQVFPEKSKSDLSGVGSYVTKSQYDASLPAHIMYSEERVEKDVMAKKFERMEEKYERMEKKLDCLLDVFHKYTSQTQAAGGTSMPMIPMMIPIHGQSLSGINSATSRNKPTLSTKLCELLDCEGNCVAVAKEVTDPMHRGNCHNYVLDPLVEFKVSMITRNVLQAKLYKAEKNPDAKTIREVGVGDFLVWPQVTHQIHGALILDNGGYSNLG